jgi:hypothetical protein
MLTAERLRELLHYDPETGVFTRLTSTGRRWKPGIVPPSLHQGYLRIGVDKSRHKAHRLAWLYVHGEWPRGDIDHINGVTTDNRIANLRDVCRTVNAQNIRTTKRNASHKLLGANLHVASGLYHPTIRVYGKVHSLGYFKTPEAAHAAYITAKRRLHEGCTI